MSRYFGWKHEVVAWNSSDFSRKNVRYSKFFFKLLFCCREDHNGSWAIYRDTMELQRVQGLAVGLFGSACHSSSEPASSGKRKKINFRLSNKRPCSYYHPEASLTQRGLTAGKEKAAQWTDSLCIICTQSLQRTHRQSLDSCRLLEASCVPRGGVHPPYRQVQCARGTGVIRKKTYWTQSNEVTEEWLPCLCTPCEDKQSLFLLLLTSTPVSLGYLFHQKRPNLFHEDKWATTGGVFHV